MIKPAQTSHFLIRVFVLAASVALAWWRMGLEHQALQLIFLIHAGMVLAGPMLARPHLKTASRAALLTGDVLALGCTAWLATVPLGAPVSLHAPFLAGFVITVLVAFVGHRPFAGILGAMAGLMLLGLSSAYLSQHGTDSPPTHVVAQALWIILVSLEITIVAGFIARESQSAMLHYRVERELREREAEASELVSLAQHLADSASLAELSDAVIRHLRCHLDVRARAMIVESEGNEYALWEESGRLEGDHLERRRGALQKALQRAGSSHAIKHLQGRSVGTQELSRSLDFKSVVDVPVRSGGRVAGVILVADPARGAIAPQRITILVDIARRVGEALQRLQRRRGEEHRRTSLLLRQMREGVVLIGPDGSLQLANPAATEVIERDAEGGNARIGEVSLAELADAPPGIPRRFRTQRPATEHEQEAEYICTAVGVVDDGKRMGTLLTIRDVTEEELARRRLVHAEKTTLVGQTLAGVAHELNNPLAALVGYADLLGTIDIAGPAKRPVEQMREQAMRATRIVRNLLNFARKKNPQRALTRLGDLVEGTLELFAYEARMAGVTVHRDMPTDLPPVLADKHSLQQILVNLVQNGLHALAGWDGPREIHIDAHASGGEVLLRVRDTGPGVPDELRGRIFRPFFTTKGSNKGTGLGLALSTTIAREHGGELLLEPDSGEGACFVLRLPVHDGREEAPTPVLERAGRRPLPERLLVVDDEDSVRESLVAQLGKLGSQVDSAATGTEAERMLSEGTYDAVLMDVRMPGTSGLDLHRTLRERNPRLARRVVFMTGDFVNDELLGTVEETGNILLEKPFTMDELTHALVQPPQNPAPSFLTTTS